MSTPQVVSVIEVANEVKEIVAIPESVQQNGPREPEIAKNDCQQQELNLTAGLCNIDTPPTDPATMVHQNNTSNISGEGKRKRVCFPEDANVVSGYMDPPSPWHDGKTMNTVVSGSDANKKVEAATTFTSHVIRCFAL